MRDQGSEAATIACCLEIEEKRLVLWSRSAGLFDETCLIPTSDLDTVISTLRQIEVITQDAGTLRTRYGLKDDTPAEDGEVRAPIRYIIGGPELSPSQVSRGRRRVTAAKLAMRWLFDRGKFEKIVQDLRTLNNGLNALLQEGQAANYHRDFAMMGLRSTSTDNVNTLRAIREAAQDAYDSLARASDQRFHTLMLQIRSAPGVHVYGTAPLISMSVLTIPFCNEPKNRDICLLDHKPVLLEWRKHQGESPQTVSFLKSRTEGLATLLGRTPKPQTFRVLDCIGYCHDEINERFGLIFCIPPQFSNTGTTPEMLILRDLLQSRTQSKTPLPTLHDRFHLAASLTNSLLQLHAAKWLHRSLSSANVIFLRRPSTAQPGGNNNKSLFEDHFIVGFGYSREDAPGALSLPVSTTASEVAYQDPDLAAAPRQGYRAAFDAYSLGVILLEIGFWRSVDGFLKPQYTAAQNRDRLLKYRLSGDLAHRMGTAYEEATMRMLCGEAYGEEDGAGEGERLVRFFQRVVVPVERALDGS